MCSHLESASVGIVDMAVGKQVLENYGGMSVLFADGLARRIPSSYITSTDVAININSA